MKLAVVNKVRYHIVEMNTMSAVVYAVVCSYAVNFWCFTHTWGTFSLSGLEVTSFTMGFGGIQTAGFTWINLCGPHGLFSSGRNMAGSHWCVGLSQSQPCNMGCHLNSPNLIMAHTPIILWKRQPSEYKMWQNFWLDEWFYIFRFKSNLLFGHFGVNVMAWSSRDVLVCLGFVLLFPK